MRRFSFLFVNDTIFTIDMITSLVLCVCALEWRRRKMTCTCDWITSSFGSCSDRCKGDFLNQIAQLSTCACWWNGIVFSSCVDMWWVWRLVCWDFDKPCLASKQFRSVTADICALQALEINTRFSGFDHIVITSFGWAWMLGATQAQPGLTTVISCHVSCRMDRLNSVVMEARIGRFT